MGAAERVKIAAQAIAAKYRATWRFRPAVPALRKACCSAGTSRRQDHASRCTSQACWRIDHAEAILDGRDKSDRGIDQPWAGPAKGRMAGLQTVNWTVAK